MITMLGLFIVVTYVEQRLIVLPNTAGKKDLYGSTIYWLLTHYMALKNYGNFEIKQVVISM